MELGEIRNKIDVIDEQLLRLFLERMECSKAVAEYKIAHGLPVLNQQRENEILQSVAKKSGENSNNARLLFSTIMDISRAAQYPIVTRDNPIRKTIKQAFENVFSPKKIGCQGVAGSYSSAAVMTLYGDCEITYFPSFEEVFASVQSGEIDAGVIPVENSYAGSVVENYDYLIKYGLHINSSVDLPVSHCLVASNGADMSTIKSVYSHEQALNQCSKFIKQNKFTAVSSQNTAMAAQYVSEQKNPKYAAIASKHTAEIYNLKILAENIQDSEINCTKFIVVSRNMSISEDAKHISLAFSIPHTSGSLYKTLSKLAAYGLNMTKIESRPDKTSPFEYIFYLDFCGNLNSSEIVGLLCGMSDELPFFKILGNY